MKGLRAILAALYSAHTALSSIEEGARERLTGEIGDFAPDLSEDLRRRLAEIATCAEAMIAASPGLADEDRRLLLEIVDSSRRMQWLTDTLTAVHASFNTPIGVGAGEFAPPRGPVRAAGSFHNSGSSQVRAGAPGDSVICASWAEIQRLVTEEATTDLTGAALRGDRVGMRHALDDLAALARGEDRSQVLVMFVRHLIALAGWLYRVGPLEIENAIDAVEQLPIETLEEYAHKFTWLAYTAGTSDCEMTVN